MTDGFMKLDDEPRVRTPGPRGQLLFGSAAEFQADRLGFFKRCATEYGDVFAFRAGPMRFVVINHLPSIEKMLVTDAHRFTKSRITRDVFSRVMGEGLMVSEGAFHERQRRLVQRGFDSARLRTLSSLATKHARAVIDRWRPGQAIDVEEEMASISLGVISEALFGEDLGPEKSRLLHATHDFQESGSAIINSGLLLPRWLPTPKNRKLAKAVAEVDAVVDKLIDARKRDATPRSDLLSLFMTGRDESGTSMPLHVLRDEIRTLFAAGYETSANALTWAAYCLSQNPTFQPLLAGDSDEPSPYATWFAKETLRAYCPVWAFNRSPLSTLVLGGHELRPSDLVIVSPYLLHADPRHFENPERFDPERFSPERDGAHPKLAFMPFGAGPRACVGARLALSEIAAVSTAVARRFRLELLPGAVVRQQAFLTVRPAGGLELRVAALDRPAAGQVS
jgi:cytochrome P450